MINSQGAGLLGNKREP